MNITKDSVIATIIAKDYRTAAIFSRAGIDFCCNGNRTIEAACRQQNTDASPLILNLQQTLDAPAVSGTIDYQSWPLDLLADFIEKKHHRYVTEQTPVIMGFLEKVNKVHGIKHPELAAIKQLFEESAGDLTAHMKKEELMLFPFIRKMVQVKQEGRQEVAAPFGTVQNPIRMMLQEHDTEGARFRQIKALSNGYTVPEDACNTYRVVYALLQAFEEDLHLHIHLENNILFPGAVALEQSFTGVN